MFAEPEFWVAVAFFILMGVFAYVGVHRTVLKALDHRSERIKTELDDARRLKEEAAKLLAEYKTRQASAEREAQDIIASAKADAERIATEAKAKKEGFPPPPHQDRREQDRARRSAGTGRRPRRGGRGRRDRGLPHPVAIGEGRDRRRSARQGHHRSPRKAELILSRRPCESRDPYAVHARFGTEARRLS